MILLPGERVDKVLTSLKEQQTQLGSEIRSSRSTLSEKMTSKVDQAVKAEMKRTILPGGHLKIKVFKHGRANFIVYSTITVYYPYFQLLSLRIISTLPSLTRGQNHFTTPCYDCSCNHHQQKVRRRGSVGRALAGNGKVAGSILESGISSLCPWERQFALISHWGHAVYPSWWPSPTKDLQTEPQKGMSCVGVADIRWMPGSYERTNRKKNALQLLQYHCILP